MQCPYANVIDKSGVFFVNIDCYCMAPANPGNRNSEQTKVGVDLNKCANNNKDEYLTCPHYKKSV